MPTSSPPSSPCSPSKPRAPDVYALTEPLPPAPPSLLAGTPVPVLAALAALLAAGLALVHAGAAPRWTAGAMAMVAGHGALFVSALAWRDDGHSRAWWAAPALAIPLLAFVAL